MKWNKRENEIRFCAVCEKDVRETVLGTCSNCDADLRASANENELGRKEE